MTRPWKPHVAVRGLEAALRARGWATTLREGAYVFCVATKRGRAPVQASTLGIVWVNLPAFEPWPLPRSPRELRELLRRLR